MLSRVFAVLPLKSRHFLSGHDYMLPVPATLPLLPRRFFSARSSLMAASATSVDAFTSGDGRLPVLKVKKLSERAVLPSRSSALAAGYDLSSASETLVPARGKAVIPTDLSIAIPQGCYGRIAPRSGLALKHSIDVGAGVIDADYRGPLKVILFNHSDADFQVNPGDRIAQLILEVILVPEVVAVDDLDGTARGDGGFGSTGI